MKYKDEEYRVGNAVFLQPSAFKFKYTMTYQEAQKPRKDTVNEEIYPEFYRKCTDHVKGSNQDTPEPFHIGYINAIYATTTDLIVPSADIYIKVNKMYRPENTHRDSTLVEQADLNMVYWSDEGRFRTKEKSSFFVINSDKFMSLILLLYTYIPHELFSKII